MKWITEEASREEGPGEVFSSVKKVCTIVAKDLVTSQERGDMRARLALDHA